LIIHSLLDWVDGGLAFSGGLERGKRLSSEVFNIFLFGCKLGKGYIISPENNFRDQGVSRLDPVEKGRGVESQSLTRR